MLEGKKIIVVMPAYNAEHTIERTFAEVPRGIVDEVVVVDDHSDDETVAVAERLGVGVVIHDRNRGYGANQKTCYGEALARGADIVVMLHPDYQYPPRLITAMGAMLVSGQFDVVIGSRMLGGRARANGMPHYKYFANRALTWMENLILGVTLSEYHTGYRAFTRQVLETLPLGENSDDFVFDNQMLVQTLFFGYRIGEISAPCRYHSEASSINFSRSVRYGIGVLSTCLAYLLERAGLARAHIFDVGGRKLGETAGPVSSRRAGAEAERASQDNGE